MSATPQNMTEHCTECGAELEAGQIGICDDCQKDASSDGSQGITVTLEVKLSFVLTLASDRSAPLVDDALRRAAAENINNFIVSKGGVSVDDVDAINLMEISCERTGALLFRS